MKPITVGSQIRGWLEGYQVAPGDVTFKLVKVASGAEVEPSRGKWKKWRDDLSNSVLAALPPIDAAFVDAVLAEGEMQCELRVDAEYRGTPYPGRGTYLLFRHELTLVAKRGDGSPAPHLPFEYRVTGYVSREGPLVGTTDGRGEAICPLPAPGEVTFHWVDWQHVKWEPGKDVGKRRVAEVRPTCRFVWPVPGHTPFRQYVNMEPAHPDDALPVAPAEDSLEARRYSPKAKVRIGAGPLGAPGVPVFAKLTLAGPDTTDEDGAPLTVGFDGESVKIGATSAPKRKVLEDGAPPFADYEIDFKGYGGVRATLAIGGDERCADATLVLDSWRKVNLRFYYPVPGYWPNDAVPAGVAAKVAEAFADVFIETPVTGTADLFATFAGLEADEKVLKRITTSRADADAIGLPAGDRQGPDAIVWYRMEGVDTHPAYTVKAKGDAAVWRDLRNTLHVITGHRVYSRSAQTLSLPLEKQSSDLRRQRAALEAEHAELSASLKGAVGASATQRRQIEQMKARVAEIDVLLEGQRGTLEKVESAWMSPDDGTWVVPRDVDSAGNPSGELVLDWSDGKRSTWKGTEKTRGGEVTYEGDIDDDFLEIDMKKNLFRVVLPKVEDGVPAPNAPGRLVARGVKIELRLKFRTLQPGVAGGGEKIPLVYAGWMPSASAGRAAYCIVHEIAHILGFAHAKTPHYYNVNRTGDHCAFGTGLKAVDKPKIDALLAKHKFGACVMWGSIGAETTTAQIEAAGRFCAACAALIRVTDIGPKVGRRAWP